MSLEKKLKRSNAIYREAKVFFKLYLAVLALHLLPLFLSVGYLFFETGKFISYVKAFFSDFDLNIVNHVPERQAWLVTKTFFHPDFHSDIQTPFFFPISIFEYISKFFCRTHPTLQDLDFIFSSITLNYIELGIGFYFLYKISKLFEYRFQIGDVIFFILATPFAYLVFTKSTSLEVFSFPFTAYLLYYCLDKKQTFNPYLVGFSSGVLFTLRLSYFILPIYIIYIAVKTALHEKNWKFVTKFMSAFLLIYLAYAINYILKYGGFIDPNRVILTYYLDMSWANLYSKFGSIFLSDSGMMISSPFYYLVILGMYPLYKIVQNRMLEGKLFFCVLILLLFVHITPSFFMMGNFMDCHYPGRLLMRSAPVLFLSYIALRAKFNSFRYCRSIQWLLVFCSLFYMFYFQILSNISIFYFAGGHLSWDAFLIGVTSYFGDVRASFFTVWGQRQVLITYTFLVSLVAFFLIRSKHVIAISRYIFLTTFIIYPLITICNVHFSKGKIELLKREGFYVNKAIGDGEEILMLDYFLDHTKYVRSREVKSQGDYLDKAVPLYYFNASKQIIKSNFLLDDAIKKNDPNFSFLISRFERVN